MAFHFLAVRTVVGENILEVCLAVRRVVEENSLEVFVTLDNTVRIAEGGSKGGGPGGAGAPPRNQEVNRQIPGRLAGFLKK